MNRQSRPSTITETRTERGMVELTERWTGENHAVAIPTRFQWSSPAL